MPERPIVRFEHLNPVEKAVYVTGAVATVATTWIERALERAADLIVQAERAFEQGRREGSVNAGTAADIEDARFRDV